MTRRLSSPLEAELLGQIRLCGLPEPVPQWRFAYPRRWLADFAYPDHMLLIEVEGGIYTGGRHVRAVGFRQDCRKYNRAVELGLRVLRFTADMVRSGEALALIERVLRGHKDCVGTGGAVE